MEVRMMRDFVRVLSLSAILAMAVSLASAQPPPEGGVPPQVSEFREKHKYTFQLMETVRKLMEMEKDPKVALTKEQAKRVLDILKPLQKKEKLTQEEAKEVLKELKKVLTAKQLTAMGKIKPQRRPMAGQPRPPQEGSQRRPAFDPERMKNFNPFYLNPSDPRSKERPMARFLEDLERKARGK
jgi:polyhydroxyalkanoate synthesis regulator phasin